MEPEADGVSAVGIKMGADAKSAGLPACGKGQFYLVCAGTLIIDGKALPERSLIRAEPGDPSVQLQAGPDGAQVLALQFAAPSDRPGTDPVKLAERSATGYVNLRADGN